MAFVEAPPHFSGAPKKSKTGLILGCLALAVVLCCCGGGGAFFYFGRGAIGKAMGLVGCGMAVGQQRDGMLAYAKAHGGKLPPALSWQDDIKPFVTKLPSQGEPGQPFNIPRVTDDFCDQSGSTSITMNATLAGQKTADVKDPMSVILLFETPGRGRNKSAKYAEQPFGASPKLFEGARRGWIVQPLYGQASYKDQSGRVRPAPSAGSTSATFGGGDAPSKD